MITTPAKQKTHVEFIGGYSGRCYGEISSTLRSQLHIPGDKVYDRAETSCKHRGQHHVQSQQPLFLFQMAVNSNGINSARQLAINFKSRHSIADSTVHIELVDKWKCILHWNMSFLIKPLAFNIDNNNVECLLVAQARLH